MLDLDKLSTFLHVAQYMSFSDAATHLHLSQPAVSHHIKMLERDLGVKLFERSGTYLKLTEAGYFLLPQARRLLNEAIEIQHMVGSLDDRIAGHLTIVCSTTAGKYVTAQLAGRFREQHSDVSVSVLKCTVPHIVPYLLSEEADVGVVSHDACGKGMECREFFSDHIILIVGANHPWASRQCIEPSELLGMPIIVRESTSGTRHAMLAELAKHCINIDDLNIFLEVSNAEAIIKVVEANFGVTFVSRLAAEWALKTGTVCEISVQDVDMHRKLYLIKPGMQNTSRAVEAFWSFVHGSSNADLLHLAEK